MKKINLSPGKCPQAKNTTVTILGQTVSYRGRKNPVTVVVVLKKQTKYLTDTILVIKWL